MSGNEFEREKICYEQNCENFRALNKIMWQVPIIAMTLTGGLWYGVEQLSGGGEFKTALLWFGGFANISFVLMLFRIRKIIEILLKKMDSFESGIERKAKGYFVVIIFSILLLCSSGYMFYIAYNGNTFQAPENGENVAEYTGAVEKNGCD